MKHPGRYRFSRRKSGVAYLWIVVIMPVLAAFMGLAIDVGHMIWVGHQLQITADASALAGARYVREDIDFTRQITAQIGAANTVGGASLILDLNDGNAPDGEIVLGFYDRLAQVFHADSFPYNAVQVRARRTVDSANGALPLLFGSIFGMEDVNMQRMSIAMVGGDLEAGIIVLNEKDKDTLKAFGKVRLAVDNGAIHVNSNHDKAVYVGGAASVDADMLSVVGGVYTTGSPDLPDNITTGMSKIADPLANLPAPVWDPANDLGGVNNSSGTTLNLQPGYYSGGIQATGGTLNLAPGIYILDGAGLDVGGNANIYAPGVLFYIIGSGNLDLRGTGDIVMRSPDPLIDSFPEAATYQGVGVFQARDNPNEGSLMGTAGMYIEGTYYLPAAHMGVGGTPSQMGTQLVSYTLEVFGNANLYINYDGRYPIQGTRVFLVQ